MGFVEALREQGFRWGMRRCSTCDLPRRWGGAVMRGGEADDAAADAPRQQIAKTMKISAARSAEIGPARRLK
ncbi:MAG: hypothetical protein PHQ28_17740 [Mycobacterium sp.]|nr:hypothetical protein [Mycobacterium sp.]